MDRSHQALADDLAAFEGAEAVALFPTGFAANLGTIAALVAPGDAVYADRLDHACLIDGTHLAGPGYASTPTTTTPASPPSSSVTGAIPPFSDRDSYGVFSMDGDLAPLADLVDIAEQFGAILLVDEAHGTGVFGDDGREMRHRRAGSPSGSTFESAHSRRGWVARGVRGRVATARSTI